MVTIRVPWNENNNPELLWTDTAVSILKHFGLPGYKYTTELTEEYMNFNFHNDHDGLLCKILLSDVL